MQREIKNDDDCVSAGRVEIPNSGDDASYPRDYYSDSFPKDHEYAKALVIRSFLDQLGYTRAQIDGFCSGECPAEGVSCLPVGITNASSDSVELKLVTMNLPNNRKIQMYWAHAETRGRIQMTALCDCVSTVV